MTETTFRRGMRVVVTEPFVAFPNMWNVEKGTIGVLSDFQRRQNDVEIWSMWINVGGNIPWRIVAVSADKIGPLATPNIKPVHEQMGRPMCAKCNKPVDSVGVFQEIDARVYEYACHGETEQRRFTDEQIREVPAFGDLLTLLGAAAFDGKAEVSP